MIKYVTISPQISFRFDDDCVTLIHILMTRREIIISSSSLKNDYNFQN